MRCSVFRIHFHLSMQKSTLKAFRRKLKPDLISTQCKNLSTSQYRVRVSFSPDPKMFVADFRVSTASEAKYINVVWMRKCLALIQNFVDTARRLGCRKFAVSSVTSFLFPKSQRFVSFPHFPFTIEHEVSGKGLGQTQLAFVGINFQKSPIGLLKVVFGSLNGSQQLELLTNMQTIGTLKLPERLYFKACRIAQLFLA